MKKGKNTLYTDNEKATQAVYGGIFQNKFCSVVCSLTRIVGANSLLTI